GAQVARGGGAGSQRRARAPAQVRPGFESSSRRKSAALWGGRAARRRVPSPVLAPRETLGGDPRIPDVAPLRIGVLSRPFRKSLNTRSQLPLEVQQMLVKLNVLAAASVALLAGAASAQDMVVKIGHVGPVSGAQAHYGKDNENGARMAIEDLNAKG